MYRIVDDPPEVVVLKSNGESEVRIAFEAAFGEKLPQARILPSTEQAGESQYRYILMLFGNMERNGLTRRVISRAPMVAPLKRAATSCGFFQTSLSKDSASV